MWSITVWALSAARRAQVIHPQIPELGARGTASPAHRLICVPVLARTLGGAGSVDLSPLLAFREWRPQVPTGPEVLDDAIWCGANLHLPWLARPHPDTKRCHAESTVHLDALHVAPRNTLPGQPPRPVPGSNPKAIIIHFEQAKRPRHTPPAAYGGSNSVGPAGHLPMMPDRPGADTGSTPRATEP
jgi:hypothetical protein